VKTRYFLFLSYKGTSYHGWQIQPDSVTVQKVLDEALSTVLNKKTETTGAGRTDTGVHALFFCAHFESSRENLQEDNNLIFKLNRFLPRDISINSIRKVYPDAHARFSAISRTYKYFISRKKDPFAENSSWYLYGNIDVNLMNEASALLLEQTDFTSFSRLHSDNKTNICHIMYAGWEEKDQILIFTIKADRFLRNMVRAIVGTMIELGTGRKTISQFIDIMKANDRCKAGKSAPAEGLYLTHIEYPVEIFQQL
jgi:tRNA pseudouridine38-40 synthase